MLTRCALVRPQLLVFGSVFILAIPIVVLVANVVLAPYVRAQKMACLSLT